MPKIINKIILKQPIKKKRSRKQLVKLIDQMISKIIRTLEPRCVLCGSEEKLGAGHIFSRRAYATRWDLSEEGNVHTQCWPCNFLHVRDPYPYFNWYIKKFGQKKLDELRMRYNQETHYKTIELEEMLNQLKEL